MAVPVALLTVEAPRAGVVLVSDVGGVDAAVESYAKKLVDEGYTVAMPDIWWRLAARPPVGTAEERAAAEDLLRDGELLRDVAGARDALGAIGPKVVLGFGVGGNAARSAGAALPGWSGIVEFYGRLLYPGVSAARPVQPLDLLPGLGCAYLGHFGEQDPICPPHHVEDLRRRLGFVCQPNQVLTYPGRGHGFMNPAEPAWNAQAAALAWQRTLRFLDNVAP